MGRSNATTRQSTQGCCRRRIAPASTFRWRFCEHHDNEQNRCEQLCAAACRLAKPLSEGAQRDADALLGEVRSGDVNPGIVTRALGNGFYELRGANAGRVIIIKQTDAGAFDIVGKLQGHVRGDAAKSTIINRLMRDYDAL